MKTKSLDQKDNEHDNANEAASRVATAQQNDCCDCDDPGCCPPGCCGQ